MNKTDRRVLSSAVKKYYCIFMQASHEFTETIDKLRSNEEEKLNRLPANLQDSCRAENIEEAIEMLEELQENLSEINTLCDEIAEKSGTQINFTPQDTQRCLIEDGKRDNRFQILLSDELMALMKLRALELGFSCNELICQSLQNELLKDPFGKQ